jgi:putative flippase GtrA
LWIAADEVRHPQVMAIMNVVWPVTALYLSVFALWGYYKIGRAKTQGAMHDHSMPMQHAKQRSEPTAGQVAVGTSHCGAGCMLADVVCEFWIATAGIMLFGSMLWAEYAIDFAGAWALGIVFQYFAIQPMRHLPVGQALIVAIKADTLSIVAFQIGMYAWMALVFFRLFPHPHLTPFEPQYWLMMQIAMICGYATSFPMNRWLIRAGLKEAM